LSDQMPNSRPALFLPACSDVVFLFCKLCHVNYMENATAA